MPVIAVGPLDKPLRTRLWDIHCQAMIGRKININPWKEPELLSRHELKALGFVIAAANLSAHYDQQLKLGNANAVKFRTRGQSGWGVV